MKRLLGQLWQQVGRYNRAVQDYSRAAQDSPDPALAYVNWGIDLAQEGKLEEALAKFEQAVAISPDRAEPLNNWGVALAKLGRLDEAIDKFQRALEVEPDCVNSWILWGAALLEQGKIDEAESKYEKAVTLNPGNPEPFVNWGIALSRLGRFEEAMTHFQAALAVYSYQPQVYFLWGAVLAELERYEEAIEKFKITLRHMPKHAEAFHFWSIALNRLGRYEEAIEKARHALDLETDNAEIFLNMGDALANLGQYRQAIDNYRHTVRLEPELADAYLSWGIALCKLGENEEGYAQFEKALALDADLTQAHYYWGASLNANRRYAEALPHLQTVYEQQPEHLDNLINYGLARIHLGEVELGYTLLREAARRDPWNPQVHFLLGTQQLALGNVRAAMDHLQKALEVKKDFTDAAINLSLALCELGNTEEAVRTLRPFMRAQQDSPEVNFFYGMILYRHNDLRDAAEKFERALALRPGYPEALLGLAEIALRREQPEPASRYLAQILEAHPQFVPALYLSGLARMQQTANNPESQPALTQALACFEKTLHYDPHHEEARINRAFIMGRLGQVDEMNRQFEALMRETPQDPGKILAYWTRALKELGREADAEAVQSAWQSESKEM